MTVWLVTGMLVWEAVDRIRNPQPVDGRRALVLVDDLLPPVLTVDPPSHVYSGDDWRAGQRDQFLHLGRP